MECRLRWRLCRPPPLPSPASSARCSANLPTRFQNVVRPASSGRRSLTAPRRRTARPYSFIVGRGEVLLSLLRQGFSSSPLFPPPSIINHSRSDRKSRDAPISSAPTLFSTGCFLPILALTISVSLVFPASGDLVNLEYETWKFLGTDWSSLEEKKRRLS